MTDKLEKCYKFLFGPPLNPNAKHKNILLAAFLAWIGLGADGLSSACYGPEEAFLALGQYTELGLYLALATALTVFIISMSYNQVIELFPSGGGGYKVATTLINPIAGLISGGALIVDYILTITISIASGIDALFSLLPLTYQPYKWPMELLLIILLGSLNLRGAKESIQILMPIFICFFVSHLLLIIYGIGIKIEEVPSLIPNTLHATSLLSSELGWFFVASLFLRAYSMGGGTYTGIEAVSNNVNMLTEPRVTTGKITMLYMALSLSFTAGGIILLYLLWHVAPVPGQTLNAVTFSAMMDGWQWYGMDIRWLALPMVLFFEASLLFVAANTGFLGGPAVLANMAVDCWVPTQFRHLSTRLVTQNGVIFMSIAAIFLLFITHGEVKMLVILYSINVFLTFTLSLLGLCIHWWAKRKKEIHWVRKLTLASVGFLVSICILFITLIEKFLEGAWLTVLITGLLIFFSLLIKRHYKKIDLRLHAIVQKYYKPEYMRTDYPRPTDKTLATAVLLVDKNLGLGLHTLQRIQKLFPDVYKNFIFISVGEINTDVFRKEDKETELENSLNHIINYFVYYCRNNNMPASGKYRKGIDIIETTEKLAKEIKAEYPNSVFFSGEILFENETWFNKWLYDHTSAMIQRALHLIDIQMVLLPMKLNV